MLIINKMKLIIKKIIILIVAYLVYIYFFKGYMALYPTIPVYPNNLDEAKVVKHYIKNRKQEDIDFFHLTNNSVAAPFLPLVEESKEELEKITYDKKVLSIIVLNKYVINRARPQQVDKSIKPIDTSTAKTPAYPAGHAFQAYLLSKKLGKKYPNKKEVLEEVARKCDMCRVQAGLHYPSDGIYSKKLVELLY